MRDLSSNWTSYLSRRRRRPIRGLALASLLFLGACGGGSAAYEHVQFRASDGVLLAGRLYGDGDRGVVLSHMGARTTRRSTGRE
jgi:hypothetical protein